MFFSFIENENILFKYQKSKLQRLNLNVNPLKSITNMPVMKLNSNSTTETVEIMQKQSPLGKDSSNSSTTSEDYLNKKIAFIQNHINNLLIEITNLPEPWTYAVTEDGRVFFIK